MTNQEIVSAVADKKLRETLADIINEYNGHLSLYGELTDDALDITIYSDKFNQDHLDVLMKHGYYGLEITYSSKYNQLKTGIECASRKIES